MAKPSQLAASSPASSTVNARQISKPRSDACESIRSTRRRSKMLALQTKADELVKEEEEEEEEELLNEELLNEELVNEEELLPGSSSLLPQCGKGKGKGKGTRVAINEDVQVGEHMGSNDLVNPVICSETGQDTKPFRIMDLPTEIRLEIYRACLTRPYKILLSKREQSPADDEDRDRDRDGDESTRSSRSTSRFSRAEAPTGTANTNSGNTNSDSTNGGNTTGGNTTGGNTTGGNTNSGNTNNGNTNNGNTNNGSTNNGSTNSGSTNSGSTSFSQFSNDSGRRLALDSRRFDGQPEPVRNQSQDPLITNILRASKDIYKEARSVLYSENHFVLDLNTAMQTLGHLHQRSRRHIKHVELEIPTYNEILERFQETVRLSLRYCSGLQKFIIHMPFSLPGTDGSGTTGNTTVYANGFDILRWLPQECDIVTNGNICAEIETVVNKHLHLARALDKLAYARRQLISNETSSLPTS